MSECVKVIVVYKDPPIRKVTVYRDPPIRVVVVKVGVPGPPGPASLIVNENPHSMPYDLTDNEVLTVGQDQRIRQFLKGASGTVSFSITDGFGTQELYLFGTDDTDYAELVGSNLALSGRIVLKNNSQIVLHWISGLNKWVEAGRNEII